MLSKLKSSFTERDRKMSRVKSPRERLNSVGNKFNVNDEYMESLRTNSYTEIWSKVQGQLRRTKEEHVSMSPLSSYLHHPECILEPRQETLTAMIAGIKLHALILDYFQGSLEACKICGFLLQCIDQTRTNYLVIQRVLRLSKRVSRDYTKEQFMFITMQFEEFASLENPLSGLNRVQFHEIHELYSSMLGRLKSKRKKIMRRAKAIKFCKRAAGISLMVTCAALAITPLLLAVHALVGLLAAPVVLCSWIPFLKRKSHSTSHFRSTTIERLSAQLDAAAKGVYILGRDFDTMSRLTTRLHDEIEHSNAVIGICLRNGKRHLMEEVVKELRSNESCFLEQLAELEEHVYLCFLTINRARRLVLQEIVMPQQH